MASPPTSTGARTVRIPIPLAFIAVISFSAARRLKAYRTATSTAMGSVIATVNGTESIMNSAMTLASSPFPTSSPNFLAMYCRSMSDVSAVEANTNGPMCSFRTYLPIIFKRPWAVGLWGCGLSVSSQAFRRAQGRSAQPPANIPSIVHSVPLVPRMIGASLLLLATVTGCDSVDRFRGAKTAFSGDSALAYARAQVAFGPRVPGTEGHRRAGDWIVAQLRARADSVEVQSWTHVTQTGAKLAMRNIIARFRPGLTQRVLYVTHWDTRPTADNDRNLGARQRPIVGANDGASGV